MKHQNGIPENNCKFHLETFVTYSKYIFIVLKNSLNFIPEIVYFILVIRLKNNKLTATIRYTERKYFI